MNTRRLWPEIIISGACHLAWLVLLTIHILGRDPFELLQSLSTISGGAAALLASAIFGASYGLGSMVDRVLSDVSELVAGWVGKPQLDSVVVKNLKDPDSGLLPSLFDRGMLKAFFRSISLAILLNVGVLLCVFGTSNSKVSAAIIVVGAGLEICFVAAFITQRRYHRLIYDEMNTH